MTWVEIFLVGGTAGLVAFVASRSAGALNKDIKQATSPAFVPVEEMDLSKAEVQLQKVRIRQLKNELEGKYQMIGALKRELARERGVTIESLNINLTDDWVSNVPSIASAETIKDL